MSTVGNIEGGSAAAQFEMLRRMQEKGGGPPPPRPEEIGSEEGAEHLWSLVSSRAEALGMDTERVAKLRDEVKSAVMDVLEDADTSDPDATRAAVQSAILSTLEENGVDTAKLKEDMAAHRGAGPGRPRPPNGPPPGERPSGADSGSASSQSASASQGTELLARLTELFKLVDEEA